MVVPFWKSALVTRVTTEGSVPQVHSRSQPFQVSEGELFVHGEVFTVAFLSGTYDKGLFIILFNRNIEDFGNL